MTKAGTRLLNAAREMRLITINGYYEYYEAVVAILDDVASKTPSWNPDAIDEVNRRIAELVKPEGVELHGPFIEERAGRLTVTVSFSATKERAEG